VVDGDRFQDGKWYHITGIANATHRRIYVNAEDETDYTENVGMGALESDADTYIGTEYALGTQEYFNGTIDDVRIYPYALTQDQVTQVMRQGSTSIG